VGPPTSIDLIGQQSMDQTHNRSCVIAGKATKETWVQVEINNLEQSLIGKRRYPAEP